MATTCTAKLAPESESDPDQYTYECNRKQPHNNLHAHLGPDGETIAIWCTCGECNVPQEDLG